MTRIPSAGGREVEPHRVAQVRILESWTVEPEIERAWRELALAQDNIFGTPEWFAAWSGLDTHDRPHVMVAYADDGRVIGVLPLVRSRRGPLRLLGFPAARFTDVVAPPCLPGWESAAAHAWQAALIARPRPPHALALPRVDSARWVAPIAGATPAGFRAVRRRPTVELPFIDLGDGYEAWLATRSRNFRSQLGRRRRRLEREHDARFRRSSEPSMLDTDLGTLFDLHNGRWEDAGAISAIPAWSEAFHRSFASAAHTRGWLRLYLLELGQRPVAAWYGWRLGSRFYYYQSGFDPAFSEHGVGGLLLNHTIEQAALEGATTYDLLWGDEEYKSRFATGRREAASLLLIARHRPLGEGLRLAAAATDRARMLPPSTKAPLVGLRRELTLRWRALARRGGTAGR